VDLLPDLTTLSDEALDGRIQDLLLDEEKVSLRRHLLHGRIDLLRTERNSRLRDAIDDGEADVPDPELVAETVALASPVLDADADVDHELSPMPDPSELSDEELREKIHELEREEDETSLRRRILHGQIDILTAERELRRRGHGGDHVDVDRLKEILSARLLWRPDGGQ
jgi:hypothetical protein